MDQQSAKGLSVVIGTGAPRRPIIVVIVLKDDLSRDFDPLDPTHPLHSELQV